jgi:hypothetical protein
VKTTTMISHVIISHVPNNASTIALTLRKLGILIPQKICVMPEFNGKVQFYRAYIEVKQWFYNSKIVDNLIARIQDPSKEARIVYSDDNWWTIEKAYRQDLKYTEDPAFKQWTSDFNPCPDIFKAEAKKYEEKKRIIAQLEAEGEIGRLCSSY